MNIRTVSAVLLAFLLCGCSTWDRAASYVGLEQGEQSEPTQAAPENTAAAPTPAPADRTTRSDSWCQSVAKSASNEAAGNGYDSATQQRSAVASYRQCRGASD
jgi:hypothetical protein